MNNCKKSKSKIKISAILLSMVMVLSYVGGAMAAKTDVYPFNASAVSRNAEVILWPYLTSEYVEGGDENPYNQRSYNLPNSGAGANNSGCAVVCMAIGNSIINKKSYNPVNYIASGYSRSNPMSVTTGLNSKVSITSKNQQTVMKTMYDSIRNGKPVRFFIGIKSADSGHFVLVNGYNSDAASYLLNFSDFLCVDPVTGTEVNLTNAWGWDQKVLSYCSIRTFK